MVVCGLPGLHGLFIAANPGAARLPPSLGGVGSGFFAGISAGALLVATLPHVFGIARLAPLARLATFVALVALVAAVLFLAAGGHQSGSAGGTIALVALHAVYGAALVAMLLVQLRPEWAQMAASGNGRAHRWLAAGWARSAPRLERDRRTLELLGLVGLVAALCLPGAAGPSPSAALPVSFILLAGTSGAAAVLGTALLLLRGGETYGQAVRSLGRLVGALVAAGAAVVVGESLLDLRGSAPAGAELAGVMAFGRGGWIFWTVVVVGGIALPLVALFQKRPSLRGIALASLLIVLGAFAFRMTLVAPGAAGLIGSGARSSGSAAGQVVWLNFLLFCVGLQGALLALGYRFLPLAADFEALSGALQRPAPLGYAAVLPAALAWPAPLPAAPVERRPRERMVERRPAETAAREITELALPQALGLRGWGFFSLAVGVAGFGVFSMLWQEHYGEIVTGMRTTGGGGAGWGLYVALLTYFIGLSFAGTAVAALTHLFDLRVLRPLGRMAELISILALALAAVCIVADQGRPIEALLNLPKYTKIASPFFGTFVLMCTYLFANAVFLFLDGREDAAAMAARGGRLRPLYRLWASGWRGTAEEQKRHRRVCFWLACATLLMLVAEQSTIGLIFGTQIGRPGWFSALQAPASLVLAGVSGLGLLVVVAASLRHLLGLEEAIGDRAFRWLAGALAVMTAVELYLEGAVFFTSLYSSADSDARIAAEVVFGPYARLFWTMVATLAAAFVALVGHLALGSRSLALVAGAGLAVNVGVVLKRYLIVVPSQTKGVLVPLDSGSYAPTWVEYGVSLGAIAGAICVYMVFVRIFPVVHHEHAPAAGPDVAEPGPSRVRRLAFFALTLAGGAGLATAALLSAARVGREHYDDPAIPSSPMLFILGIAIMLLSAVVYDALSTGKRSSAAPPEATERRAAKGGGPCQASS
ncbi:MAG: polysulfide reductase NrfD [Deltaproteobacteria bacterium]|nr:polysulfide reductase NrfD [Deltaproteobacteria bacterium]